MKDSSDTIGNRTRDLPTWSTVAQPTAPLCTPNNIQYPVTETSFISWTIEMCPLGALQIRFKEIQMQWTRNKSEFLTAVLRKILPERNTVLLGVSCKIFMGSWWLHLQGQTVQQEWLLILLNKAVCSFKTQGMTKPTTACHILEDLIFKDKTACISRVTARSQTNDRLSYLGDDFLIIGNYQNTCYIN